MKRLTTIIEENTEKNKVTVGFLKKECDIDITSILKIKGFTTKEINKFELSSKPKEFIYSIEESLNIIETTMIPNHFPHFYGDEEEPKIEGKEAPMSALRYTQ